MADATGGMSGGAAGWMSLGGTYFQIMAQREMGRIARIQGEQARVMSEFQAVEAERRGGVAISISQRQAAEERRQANLVASRALAVAAASGAGVSDPTMVRIIANARGEGAVRAATALYEGQARDRQMRTEAAMGRLQGFEAEAEGASKQGAYALNQMGTIAREGMSLYAKYGMKGPGKGDADLINSAGGWQDAGTSNISAG